MRLNVPSKPVQFQLPSMSRVPAFWLKAELKALIVRVLAAAMLKALLLVKVSLEPARVVS